MNHPISGANMILSARSRQLEPRDALLLRDRLANVGAELAGIIDDLPLQNAPANERVYVDPLAAPEIIFIGANGKLVSNGETPAAFVLPLYRRMFDIAVQTASNWNKAKELAKATRTLGFADWYLPAVKEMELLVSRAHNQPATYPALAQYMPTNDWYWTSTEHASDSFYAFLVNLNYGNVYFNFRSNSGLVRACREVSARQLLDLGIAA